MILCLCSCLVLSLVLIFLCIRCLFNGFSLIYFFFILLMSLSGSVGLLCSLIFSLWMVLFLLG